nr:hypothetical protein [Candidatus Sigynarchaeum springense]
MPTPKVTPSTQPKPYIFRQTHDEEHVEEEPASPSASDSSTDEVVLFLGDEDAEDDEYDDTDDGSGTDDDIEGQDNGI